MHGKRKERTFDDGSCLPKPKKLCLAPSTLEDLNTKTLKMMQEGAKKFKESQRFQKFTLNIPITEGSLNMCKLCHVMNENLFKECSFCNALCCEECIGECFVCHEVFCHMCSTCKFVIVFFCLLIFDSYDDSTVRCICIDCNCK